MEFKDWVEEHPIRTYESDFVEKLDELLKIFPNHEIKKFVGENKFISRYLFYPSKVLNDLSIF